MTQTKRKTLRFNRDFALVNTNGKVLMETHDRSRAEQLGRDLLDEGIITEVLASDLPRSRGA